ncbi:uncharacterized protein MELLADRAFT_124121 [Melampsora larici-populina 98AG31]|uniref:Secreted protein n=1 Tax=Melampsora larici-populina (strain 98AG31 / pathotype 3-4-7) TaxID=747676 RepID=F4S8D4_MELLP|nr:uncharacterized protein MELLADRAFT_124121 [Melampsora larici-populina 98AG31]EGF99079.1 secreted protein [Melampsora larici-populina 98AG31]
MFYTCILICLSLLSSFQQTVVGQCLPAGSKPINIGQCRKALATYKFDNRGLLDNDGYKNKKTCGSCGISMSQVSSLPKAKTSLDGFYKKFLEEALGNLTQACTIRSGKKESMLPGIWAGAFADGTTFFAMEVEVGDMPADKCSSVPRKPKNKRRSSNLEPFN